MPPFLQSRTSDAPSDAGVSDNSIGGGISNDAPSNPSSSSAGPSTATQPSAGYGNNITRDEGDGEKKKSSGVKGLMSKINDKLGPNHPDETKTTGFGSASGPVCDSIFLYRCY